MKNSFTLCVSFELVSTILVLFLCFYFQSSLFLQFLFCLFVFSLLSHFYISSSCIHLLFPSSHSLQLSFFSLSLLFLFHFFFPLAEPPVLFTFLLNTRQNGNRTTYNMAIHRDLKPRSQRLRVQDLLSQRMITLMQNFIFVSLLWLS